MLTLTVVRQPHRMSECEHDGFLCHYVTSLANGQTDTSTLCNRSCDLPLPAVMLLSLSSDWQGPNTRELRLTATSLY